jgi:hypothetical protein
LGDITVLIQQQVTLLGDDPSDAQTLRARFEAIRQFAAQGLQILEDTDKDRPNLPGSAAVELPHGA